MKVYEAEKVKLHLTKLLEVEEAIYFKEDEEKVFYLNHKIPFTPYIFMLKNKEIFYIVFQLEEYGIYFNDIKESFGICKIENNKCYKYRDFFKNLSPTIRKFKKAYEENNLESLLN